MSTIAIVSPASFTSHVGVDRRIANFFAPRLHAAQRDRDDQARATLVAARELANASHRGMDLADMSAMPADEIQRRIGVTLPSASAGAAFRLAELALR